MLPNRIGINDCFHTGFPNKWSGKWIVCLLTYVFGWVNVVILCFSWWQTEIIWWRPRALVFTLFIVRQPINGVLLFLLKMYFNLEQQHILFSLFYLNLEHGDLQKLWGWCSWGHMNWSQILSDISTRKVQDTLSFWLYLNLSLKLLHELPSLDSFAALIGYWTLKHANKLAHEQLLKGSIESLLSCWHIASVLRVFCGFLLLKETEPDCSRMTLRWATCQTLYQLSLTHALSALYLGTDFSFLIEQRILI